MGRKRERQTEKREIREIRTKKSLHTPSVYSEKEIL